MLVTKSELSGDKIDELERDLSHAKSTAQEADKRCEDVVRSADDRKYKGKPIFIPIML